MTPPSPGFRAIRAALVQVLTLAARPGGLSAPESAALDDLHLDVLDGLALAGVLVLDQEVSGEKWRTEPPASAPRDSETPGSGGGFTNGAMGPIRLEGGGR